jgi:hypothetical protein
MYRSAGALIQTANYISIAISLLRNWKNFQNENENVNENEYSLVSAFLHTLIPFPNP